MINCGCSTEAISLNLSVLIPLIGSVLATTIQCNKRGSIHTRNKNGFTAEELSSILPSFKVNVHTMRTNFHIHTRDHTRDV